MLAPMTKLIVALTLLAIAPAFAGLEAFSDLVVADTKRNPAESYRETPPPRDGVRITYLGTNGYLLEAPGTRILVDPYFSRISLGTAALNLPMESSPGWVGWGLRRMPKKIDGILVTHGHFDHLLDAPEVAQCTGATVFASRTSIFQARAAGLPRSQAVPMAAGDRRRIGRARVTALLASHDRLFGCCVPFPGNVEAPLEAAPRKPSHWRCGEPLAFLIEINGRRIYVDSGGTPAVLPPPGKVDLAILGAALADSRRRLPDTLQRLRPRYFLPSHQDDFFRKLDRGFAFGSMTSFPAVQKTTRSSPARLILLDYFRPWTLR
jgi:L-ascorbate metabolism protein UlaG (beta-lactamase superfamily)